MFSAFSQRLFSLYVHPGLAVDSFDSPGQWCAGLTPGQMVPCPGPQFPFCEMGLWKMTMCECHLLSPQQVKPLIWIESVIEKHSHSRIEYMIKVRARRTRSVSLGTRAVRGAGGGPACSGPLAQGPHQGRDPVGGCAPYPGRSVLWLMLVLPHCEPAGRMGSPEG